MKERETGVPGKFVMDKKYARTHSHFQVKNASQPAGGNTAPTMPEVRWNLQM